MATVTEGIAAGPLQGLPSHPGSTHRIPKDRYTSQEFQRQEAEKLWTRVWQMACREEEIPEPGDFIEHTFLEESIIIVRQDDGGLKAFFNACRHRGMQLVSGSGRVSEFRCPFHAWTYHKDGELSFVLSPNEFPCDGDYSLAECSVDSWAGFVFINLDPAPQPLAEYLGPIVTELEKFHFEKMAMTRWHTSPFGCNWKLAIESFVEVYHLAGTHPQALATSDDVNAEYQNLGLHSMTLSEVLIPSPRLGEVSPQTILQEMINGLADFGMTDILTDVDLPDLSTLELPEGVDLQQLGAMMQYQIAQHRGIDLSGFSQPELTQYQLWLVFPNLCIQALSPTEILVWLMRPNGSDPASCYIDEIILTPPPAGTAPTAAGRKYEESWRDHKPGLTLEQDWLILERIQKGVRQRSHEGQLLASVQESRIAHLHHVIDDFLGA